MTPLAIARRSQCVRLSGNALGSPWYHPPDGPSSHPTVYLIPPFHPPRLLSAPLTLPRKLFFRRSDCIKIDTSPFYSGGTHLGWCAADALIIPVRVDEHSIESLDLTLSLLSDKNRDFSVWNQRAGGRPAPKVAAIVMTMVGSKSQQRATPDNASRMYIERDLAIAEKYGSCFDYNDPADSFVITDDFVSTGRISGAKSIPISKLRVGSFHLVEKKRLQVNSSASRYQRELAYLVSVL